MRGWSSSRRASPLPAISSPRVWLRQPEDRLRWRACRRASVRSWLRGSHGVPSGELSYAVVAPAIGHGFDLQAQRVGRGDAGRRLRLPLARQHAQNHLAAGDAGRDRCGPRVRASCGPRIDSGRPRPRIQPMVEHRAQHFDELVPGLDPGIAPRRPRRGSSAWRGAGPRPAAGML
jgi:hypothetical protein